MNYVLSMFPCLFVQCMLGHAPAHPTPNTARVCVCISHMWWKPGVTSGAFVEENERVRKSLHGCRECEGVYV